MYLENYHGDALLSCAFEEDACKRRDIVKSWFHRNPTYEFQRKQIYYTLLCNFMDAEITLRPIYNEMRRVVKLSLFKDLPQCYLQRFHFSDNQTQTHLWEQCTSHSGNLFKAHILSPLARRELIRDFIYLMWESLEIIHNNNSIGGRKKRLVNQLMEDALIWISVVQLYKTRSIFPSENTNGNASESYNLHKVSKYSGAFVDHLNTIFQKFVLLFYKCEYNLLYESDPIAWLKSALIVSVI